MKLSEQIKKNQSIIPLLLDETIEGHEDLEINGQKIEFLSKSIIKVTPSKQGKKKCYVFSAGIHGNETAPIEIVSDIVLKLLEGSLTCQFPTLFIFGNLKGMKEHKRFIDFNLNRLFNKDYEKYPDAIEATRAKELETYVYDFRKETTGMTMLHLDLHTAIKGSFHEKFVICPVANKATEEHIKIFKAMNLDAYINKTTSSNTFSDFSSNMENAHAYTLELGKVRPFGENNLEDFKDSQLTLEKLIEDKEVSESKKVLCQYITEHKVIKENDSFKYLVDESQNNFFKIPANTFIYEQNETQVRYDKDTYMLFANSSVKYGQWAGILLEKEKTYNKERNMKNYLIITASSGKNLELANKIKDHVNDEGINFEVIDLEEIGLPLYSPKAEQAGIPKEASELANKLTNSEGFIFLSPEYNGSTAPLFNNSIAWISRSGDDWRSAFNNKPVVVGTHSGGGGHQVLTHMQDQLTYVGCNVVGRKILTSYSKELNLESLDDVLSRLYKIT